jgi:membrane-associated phospholipid phosphatase
MNIFSRLFSWFSLPLFTPIYALALVLFIESQPRTFMVHDSLYHYPPQIKYSFLYLFFIFIVIAPGLSLVMLRVNKSISSLSLDIQSERPVPIGIMIFYCIVLYGMMLYQQAFVPNALKAMALGGAFASIAALIINRFYKISLHAIGSGALLGFVYGYFLEMEYFKISIIVWIILFSALTFISRLWLNKHSMGQLMYGYALGFCSQLLTLYFYP